MAFDNAIRALAGLDYTIRLPGEARVVSLVVCTQIGLLISVCVGLGYWEGNMSQNRRVFGPKSLPRSSFDKAFYALRAANPAERLGHSERPTRTGQTKAGQSRAGEYISNRVQSVISISDLKLTVIYVAQLLQKN